MSDLTFDDAWRIICEVLLIDDNPRTTLHTYHFWWRTLERFLRSSDAGTYNPDGALLLPRDPKTLLAFEAWMRKPARQGGGPRYSPKSVAGATGAIKGCYAKLRWTKAIDDTPDAVMRCRRRDRQVDVRRLYTDREIRELISWSEESRERTILIPCLLLGLLAGARFSDMRTLRWGDALNGSGKLRLWGKGAKERFVPLSPVLEGYLQRLRAHTPSAGRDAYVFQGRRLGTPMAEGTMRKMINSARLAIRDLEYHSLRFTFAVKLRLQGVPIEQISKLLGHADLETTMIYLGAFASDPSLAADALLHIEQNVLPLRPKLPGAPSAVDALHHIEHEITSPPSPEQDDAS